MQIINLTPHDIVYQDENGDLEVFKASGNVARIEMEEWAFPSEDGKYNLITNTQGDVSGLPEPEVAGVVYIVSAMVRAACPDRADLWSPTSFLRDEAGNIIACTAFISN